MSLENGKNEGVQGEIEQRLAEYAEACNAGEAERAESLLLNVFQTMAMHAAAREPGERDIWEQEVEEHASTGDWKAAQKLQRKIVESVLREPTPLMSVKPRLDLAALYELTGNTDEAARELDLALTTARAGDIPTITVMVLEAMARLQISRRQWTEAAASLKEAISILPSEKLYDLSRARVLALQAECSVQLGNSEEALRLLDEAQNASRSHGENSFFGGVQSLRARMAETMALIHSRGGRPKEAAESYSEAIRRMKGICEQPHLAGGRARYRLAQSLARYAEYLEQAGRLEECAEAREESKSLIKTFASMGK